MKGVAREECTCIVKLDEVILFMQSLYGVVHSAQRNLEAGY